MIDGEDREGFSAGAAQFDSDITAGARCALGVSDESSSPCAATGAARAWTAASSSQSSRVCCCRRDTADAINLDGGGSAQALVHRGHLLNRPYSNEDQPAPESRPVVTALLFEPA